MNNTEWKQQKRTWNVARQAEQHEFEQRRREATAKRNEQNAILRAHGYRWSKVQDVYGRSDDGDNCRMVWILSAPDGRVVSVAEAMREIETAKVAKPEPVTPAKPILGYCNLGIEAGHHTCQERYTSAQCGCPCHLEAEKEQHD